MGFTKFIGQGTIDLSEAWALLMGLEVAISLNVTKMEIETDSQNYL